VYTTPSHSVCIIPALDNMISQEVVSSSEARVVDEALVTSRDLAAQLSQHVEAQGGRSDWERFCSETVDKSVKELRKNLSSMVRGRICVLGWRMESPALWE
jgi:hypothetical protein